MKKITLLIIMLAWSSAFFSQTYLSEGFEGSFLPTDWTDPEGANNDIIATTYTWAASSARANSGTKSAWFNDFFPGETGGSEVNKHRWLITPVMDLSGATTPELTYYESLKFAATPAINKVYYSIDYNGSNLGTATWMVISTTAGAETWGIKGPYTLPVSATVYVAFEYEGDAKSQWFIDDVLVREPPTCIEPSSANFTNVTANTATFNWTSGSGGTETLWDVELVDITASESVTGTPTTSGVSNPYTFSSLTALHIYHAYVRADCGVDDGTSSWSGPFVFVTAPDNDECAQAQVIEQETEIASAGLAAATVGTIDYSTDSGLASECVGGTPEEDVWYSFVAKTANVNIRFDLNFDGVAVLYSNACGGTPTVVICSDVNQGNSSFEEINATGLIVNNTYYVRVFNFYPKGHVNYASNGNFTLKIWSPDSALLGNEDFKLNEFKYYPNPVLHTLNIRAQSAIENVSIYNMLGQEVWRTAPNRTSAEIDMSALRTGSYFMRVTINGTTVTKQIIKR